MKEIDGFEEVVTTLRSSARGIEPDSYMLCHESTLVDSSENDMKPHPIGRLHWRRFALGTAMSDQQDEYEIFDAVDADTEHLFHTIFDARGAHRPPFDDVTVMDVIYIDTFKLLDAAYDEREVAEEVVEHVLNFLADSDSLVTFLKGPRDSEAFVDALRARGLTRVPGKYRDKPPFYAVSLNNVRPPLASK